MLQFMFSFSRKVVIRLRVSLFFSVRIERVADGDVDEEEDEEQ